MVAWNKEAPQGGTSSERAIERTEIAKASLFAKTIDFIYGEEWDATLRAVLKRRCNNCLPIGDIA